MGKLPVAFISLSIVFVLDSAIPLAFSRSGKEKVLPDPPITCPAVIQPVNEFTTLMALDQNVKQALGSCVSSRLKAQYQNINSANCGKPSVDAMLTVLDDWELTSLNKSRDPNVKPKDQETFRARSNISSKTIAYLQSHRRAPGHYFVGVCSSDKKVQGILVVKEASNSALKVEYLVSSPYQGGGGQAALAELFDFFNSLKGPEAIVLEAYGASTKSGGTKKYYADRGLQTISDTDLKSRFKVEGLDGDGMYLTREMLDAANPCPPQAYGH